MANPADTTNPRALRKCSVEGCERSWYGRDLCKSHYSVFLRRGQIKSRKKRGENLAFLKSLVGHQGAECVLWPFGRSGDYGAMTFLGKSISASRTMCILTHGQPPFDGAEAAHNCGNSACVNPSHIRWATHLSNIQDKNRHGTMARGESNVRAVLTEQDVRAIVASNLSQQKLAQKYGVSISTISAIHAGRIWRHITGFQMRVLGIRSGSGHPQAKISETAALEIYADQRPRKIVAASHGVSPDLVKSIRTGRTWSKVTGHKR